MVLEGKVIDIVNNEIKPNYPPDFFGNEVIAIECDGKVKIGMLYDTVQGFYTESQPEIIYKPTQLDRIEEAVLKSNEELRQEGYDNCVMDMIEEGDI